MAKKKKEPKVEKVFDSKNSKSTEAEAKQDASVDENTASNVDDFLGKETPEDHLTEKQKAKLEKLNNVKSKISKILQSSNIEIVDENFDDDYDYGSAENVDGQSQQDYDSLKALYGGKEKNKKAEVTLTIDDFDYTYIGQYLEEYDLMHLKNIKKVRIQKKRSPKLKKFLIIATMVVVVAVGAFLGFYFTREVPVYLKGVTINQNERSYYVNQKFDYTGLYLLAEYSDGTVKRVKLESKYFNNDLTTGKIERTGEENDEIMFANNGTANLVFTYQGFNVEYTVNVIRKVETGIHAIYTSGIFELGVNGYITNELLNVFIEYGEYGEELVDFSQSISVTVDGVRCVYTNDGYKVIDGTNADSVIVIRSGNFEITLDKTKNYL